MFILLSTSATSCKFFCEGYIFSVDPYTLKFTWSWVFGLGTCVGLCGYWLGLERGRGSERKPRQAEHVWSGGLVSVGGGGMRVVVVRRRQMVVMVVVVVVRMVVVVDRWVFARRRGHAAVPLSQAQRVRRGAAPVVGGGRRDALLRHADALCWRTVRLLTVVPGRRTLPVPVYLFRHTTTLLRW